MIRAGWIKGLSVKKVDNKPVRLVFPSFPFTTAPILIPLYQTGNDSPMAAWFCSWFTPVKREVWRSESRLLVKFKNAAMVSVCSGNLKPAPRLQVEKDRSTRLLKNWDLFFVTKPFHGFTNCFVQSSIGKKHKHVLFDQSGLFFYD